MIKCIVTGNFMVHVHLSKCWRSTYLPAEGVHAHLSESWRGTWQEKGWEPLY